MILFNVFNVRNGSEETFHACSRFTLFGQSKWDQDALQELPLCFCDVGIVRSDVV